VDLAELVLVERDGVCGGAGARHDASVARRSARLVTAYTESVD
jgi:hypothetical protein